MHSQVTAYASHRFRRVWISLTSDRFYLASFHTAGLMFSLQIIVARAFCHLCLTSLSWCTHPNRRYAQMPNEFKLGFLLLCARTAPTTSPFPSTRFQCAHNTTMHRLPVVRPEHTGLRMHRELRRKTCPVSLTISANAQSVRRTCVRILK